MRSIGQISDESGARSFGDFLECKGIENNIENEADGSWTIWIHSEDAIEAADKLLKSYLEEPSKPEYTEAGGKLKKRRLEESEQQHESSSRVLTAEQIWRRSAIAGLGKLTLLLIVISGVVAYLSDLGDNGEASGWLNISEYDYIFIKSPSDSLKNSKQILRLTSGLKEIREQGQIWRLISPVFLHFGLLHFLFNMLWLKDLGTLIEIREGPKKFILLLLLLAIVPNYLQYLLTGPSFGGMSGVVYGLLGFVWIKGKLDPLSGYFLNTTVLYFMLAWFFLCLFGFIEHVANTVHTVGLVLGMGTGYLSARKASKGFR